jgi:hypothetical protein
LSSRQREVVRDIWDMLKPDSGARGGYILGRDEVKRLVRDLGEMWSDDEVGSVLIVLIDQEASFSGCGDEPKFYADGVADHRDGHAFLDPARTEGFVIR